MQRDIYCKGEKKLVIRIDKYLSNAGYGTRKEIKKLIRQKRVTCGGKIVKDPALKVEKACEITIDSEIVDLRIESHIIMNKPSGYISSNVSDADYPSVLELIASPHPEYNIAGRLDADTTGLLILSTDGNLIHRIISPKKEVQKLYYAEVSSFDKTKKEAFFKGIEIETGVITKPVRTFEIMEEKGDISLIKIGIIEGKYHQVKRMFKAIGSEVVKLHRKAIGGLVLDETLESGEYRELSENELGKIFAME